MSSKVIMGRFLFTLLVVFFGKPYRVTVASSSEGGTFAARLFLTPMVQSRAVSGCSLAIMLVRGAASGCLKKCFI